ncbi:SDR family NAD(P)-dependent oxidoreductase [Microbacterium sp. 179-I 3D2 NHS]|uniref:SDR family NAD(P)-dependent oxidoreductase n=1 Tax=Microbacterium sp. 179-I 3D2 NHS TaxID=3235178 RepID=UPI0039A2619C
MDPLTPPTPDLGDRTILITGANAGIGYWCAEGLAARGARVLLGCRSPARARVAADSIRTHVEGAEVEIVPVDLGSLQSIERAASSLDETSTPSSATPV